MNERLAEIGAMGEAVGIRGLTRRFGAIAAVDSVTLSIGSGEIFGLIGPNGAGKSTLIKMLTTLLPPTSGSASVAGFDIVTQAADVRRHIGYVPQLLSADTALTGYENMLLSARLYSVPRIERRDRIAAAMERMDIADAAKHLVGTYSGGMIRRLEIAQSLLHDPHVLFLDEPTLGLDPSAREAVWERVLYLRDALHRAMIVTSHRMDEIDAFCDRVALIEKGRIIACATPAELKAKAGPGATLDDAFLKLVGNGQEDEGAGSFEAAKEARRAAYEHR